MRRKRKTRDSGGYRNVRQLDLDVDSLAGDFRAYNFILFGDVLEHLKNPKKTLLEARELLTDEGKILVSVPNIAYFTCRIKHFFGQWNYAASGIMDRTHLRFFTMRSISELIDQSCFDLLWIRGYVGLVNSPWIIRVPARWLGRVWPSLFAIQIVVAAKLRANSGVLSEV